MEALSKINQVGNEFLQIAQQVGYWVVLVAAISTLIKCAFNHDKHGATSAIITYLLMFGAMYFMPFAMNIVKDIFK